MKAVLAWLPLMLHPKAAEKVFADHSVGTYGGDELCLSILVISGGTIGTPCDALRVTAEIMCDAVRRAGGS
jgi:hypothetical protein